MWQKYYLYQKSGLYLITTAVIDPKIPYFHTNWWISQMEVEQWGKNSKVTSLKFTSVFSSTSLFYEFVKMSPPVL